MGYKGRVGIFEVLNVDNEIKRMIHGDASESEILRSARLTGMKTLLQDAVDKVRNGLTTLEEVLRVLGPQNTLEILCPRCNAMLEERYPFCPYCGEVVTPACSRCHQFLARDWKSCPYCGEINGTTV